MTQLALGLVAAESFLHTVRALPVCEECSEYSSSSSGDTTPCTLLPCWYLVSLFTRAVFQARFPTLVLSSLAE
ncbi:hypothetical protein V8D89_012657 [Ganoderma adspersum]